MNIQSPDFSKKSLDSFLSQLIDPIEWKIESFRGVRVNVNDDEVEVFIKWKNRSCDSWERLSNEHIPWPLTYSPVFGKIVDYLSGPNVLSNVYNEPGPSGTTTVYQVEQIIGIRYNEAENLFEYLIRWHGYGDEDNTWEPEQNLSCDTLKRPFDAVALEIRKEIQQTKDEKKVFNSVTKQQMNALDYFINHKKNARMSMTSPRKIAKVQNPQSILKTIQNSPTKGQDVIVIDSSDSEEDKSNGINQ